MKRVALFCSVFVISVFLSIFVIPSAFASPGVFNPTINGDPVDIAFNCLNTARSAADLFQFTDSCDSLQQMWTYTFPEVDVYIDSSVTLDDLYDMAGRLNGAGFPCKVSWSNIQIDGDYYHVNVIESLATVNIYPIFIGDSREVAPRGSYFKGYYMAHAYFSLGNSIVGSISNLQSDLRRLAAGNIQVMVNRLEDIEVYCYQITQQLNSIISLLGGSPSTVVAEARSIIQQLSVYTSTSDTSNSAKQYWSRTFVDPSSNFSMVYVSYEDLTQLVIDLANIGVTTRIYKDEAKGVYVIRDVGAWIVDPNTRSDYYSSSAAPESQYHFYQHYFSLGRGQVICSTFPSLSLLLNDLNLRVVTVWNSIENGFSSLDNSISSLGDDVSAILDYLNSHQSHETTLYVKNVYSAGSSYRIIPYESMMQMLADINVNYLDAPCYIDAVGDGFLTSSASMSSSFNIAENGYYSLIVRYREVGSFTDQVGRLCDASGNMFRAYQMDNYPFRILESVDAIRDWLENADLENNTTVNNVVNNYVDEVNVSIDSFSRILDLFNTAYDFGTLSPDWSAAADYFNSLGKDPVLNGGD